MPGQSADLARRVSIWQRMHIDPILLLLLLALTVFGLLVLYSAGNQNSAILVRQGRFLLIAYIGMIVIAQFNVERVKRLAPLAYVVGILLLIAVPLVGVGAKGAQRWLSFCVVFIGHWLALYFWRRRLVTMLGMAYVAICIIRLSAD